MKALFLACGIAALATLPVHAEEDAATRAERWQDLKHAVFGNRSVADGAEVIGLDAPARAQDAALVPITVTLPNPEGAQPADKITALYVIVDGNPSPLAGTFHFGPEADPHTVKLRVRVDQYTLMHAVAETADGRLFAAERFVKAAGGCSSPSLKDPQVAMSRLGQMRVRLLRNMPPVAGKTTVAELLISHPNNNGMQVDQLTHNFIPARFIQDVDVRYGDQLVFKLDADISLSEDPVITFGFMPAGAGPLHVEMQDSTRAVFRQDFPLTPDPS
jgi:sulfur-oxidizing protein SoxY